MTDPDQNVPTPPPGYTAEELERDNPYNAWMNDMSLETSEADARPYLAPEVTADPVHYGPGEALGNGHPDWPDDLTTYEERKAYQRGVADARRAGSASSKCLRCVTPAQCERWGCTPGTWPAEPAALNAKLSLKCTSDGTIMGLGAEVVRSLQENGSLHLPGTDYLGVDDVNLTDRKSVCRGLLALAQRKSMTREERLLIGAAVSHLGGD